MAENMIYTKNICLLVCTYFPPFCCLAVTGSAAAVYGIAPG